MAYWADELRKHYIVYHLAWPVKRVREVLSGKIAKDCTKLINMKCDERGWTILALVVNPDHIYLRVQAWPTTSAYEIVKACKGLTSHELRMRYAELHKIPSLWTKAYFASTEERVKSSQIRAYIRGQKKS